MKGRVYGGGCLYSAHAFRGILSSYYSHFQAPLQAALCILESFEALIIDHSPKSVLNAFIQHTIGFESVFCITSILYYG